ncbi:hypothetical protein Patl1_15903 [Pistacia atlantica]|uniref:Uncharacterized protein n=1 Tax=Pistacia atlantica TaxID=434234 RepID=A0ACC1BA34_9ROSI|nr:hypothetical protein Patl1_15903 [Pistacia atlantica]
MEVDAGEQPTGLGNFNNTGSINLAYFRPIELVKSSSTVREEKGSLSPTGEALGKSETTGRTTRTTPLNLSVHYVDERRERLKRRLVSTKQIPGH